MEWCGSKHCRSRQHCHDCRASEVFRDSIRRGYEVPEDADGGVFACPEGVTLEKLESMPSVRRMVAGLGEAAVGVAVGLATGQGATVDEEVKQRRLSICSLCSRFDAKRSRCRECGCFMEIKAGLASAACILGRW